MLELFFWLMFGFLSGWATALVAEPQATPKRIGRSGLSGAVGALVGGAVARHVFLGKPIIDGFDAVSLLVATVAAIIVASVFNVLVVRWHL